MRMRRQRWRGLQLVKGERVWRSSFLGRCVVKVLDKVRHIVVVRVALITLVDRLGSSAVCRVKRETQSCRHAHMRNRHGMLVAYPAEEKRFSAETTSAQKNSISGNSNDLINRRATSRKQARTKATSDVNNRGSKPEQKQQAMSTIEEASQNKSNKRCQQLRKQARTKATSDVNN
jgi:cytochrome c556